MTKEEILKDVQKLIVEIDECTGDLVQARAKHNDGNEVIALREMERLMVGAQQELTFLYDYIKEGGKDDD